MKPKNPIPSIGSPRGSLATALAIFAALLGAMVAPRVSAQTLQLNFGFNDAVPSVTTTDSVAGAVLTMTNHSGVTADLHGAAGTGVEGNGKSLDLTSDDGANTGNATGSTASAVVADVSDTRVNLGTVNSFVTTFWFKNVVRAGSGNSPILFVMGPGSVAESSLVAQTANTIGFAQNTSGNPEYWGGTSLITNPTLTSGNMTTNQWLFYALTFDGSNYRIYTGTETNSIALVNTVASSASLSFGTSATILLGNRGSLNRDYMGWLDNFRFYSGIGTTNGLGGSNFVESVRQTAAGPANVTATVGAGTVTLNWTPLSSTTVSYNVYRSAVSGGPYTMVSTPGAVTGTSFADVQVSNGVTYYYVVTSVTPYGESVYSLPVSGTPGIPVISATVISPTNNPIYAGTPVTLSATVTGTAPLVPAYVWQSDGGSGGATWTSLAGSTTNSYVLTTTGMTPNTYRFRLVVTDSVGSTTNVYAAMTLAAASAPILAANTAIVPPYAVAGSSVTMSAAFNGTQPIYYQWQFTGTNGVTANISGATSNVFTIASVQYANAGSYNLVASNNPAGVPSVLASTATNLVVTAPVIIADNSATAPTPGTYDIAQLSTTGNIGAPDGFNYYDNNGTPCGQTFTTAGNASGYSLNALYVKYGTVNGGHSAGITYTLRLYSVSGATATLISTYQNNNTAPAVALGDWIEWTGGLTNVLAASTTYAYTLNASSGYEQLGNASGLPYPGGQIVEIPAAGGTVTFGTNDFDATFDVNLVPLGFPAVQTVGISPASSSTNPVYGGTPVTLSVTAIGATPLTYVWQTDNGSGGATWTPLPNSNTNSLILNTTSLAANTYEYEVTVGNSLSSATSPVVTLSLIAASGPVLATNTVITPSGAAAGNAVSMSASFTGTPPISYQWYFNNGSGPVSIGGATSATYTIASAVVANSGSYFVTASNAIGGSLTVSSTPATLLVTPVGQTNVNSAAIVDAGPAAPNPGIYDISQLVSANPSVVPGLNYYVNNSAPPGQTFTTGTNPPTAAGYPLTSIFFQEQQGTIGSAGGTAQNYTLSVYLVSSNNAALLTAYTSTNTFAVVDGDWMQFSGLTNLLKTNTTYAFSIHNDYGLYGWFKLANDGGDGTDLYTNGQAAALPASGYGAIADSSDATIDAAFSISLTPLSCPVIVQDTAITPANCYAGNPVVMQALFEGTLPLKYQWQFTDTNGVGPVNIPGATNFTYSIASMSAANAGTYSLVASNNPGGGPCTLASTPATLALQPAPTNFVANFAYSVSGPTAYGGPGAFPSGTFWNTIANVTGGTGNALADDGATPLYIGFSSTRSYDFANNGGGIGLLEYYMLDQNSTPCTFGLNNLPQGVYNLYVYCCDGHYQKAQTIFTIGGVTQSATNTTDAAFVQNNNYVVFTNILVTNGVIGGTWAKGSAEAALNGVQVQLAYSLANPAINIAEEPSNAVVAPGQPAGFAVLAFGPPPLSYQWRANGAPITGATNSTLNFATTTTAEGIPNYDVVIANLSGMVVTSTVVNLTVRTSVNDLLWGAYSSPAWDLSTINWEDTNSQAGVAFQQGDNVMFDDSAYDFAPVLGQRLMPGSVTVNAATPYVFSGFGYLSWTMSLNLLGTSDLTLETVNDYTGNTTLSPGAILALSGAGSIADSATVYLASGATLVVTGRTDKAFTISPAQTFLGDGVFYVLGTVTNLGTMAFKAGKTGGVVTNDQLQGLTAITYGGTLELDLAGQALSAGDSIQLFSATNYYGAFAAIVPATPGTGLAWNTNALTTNGALSVVSAISLTPAKINSVLSVNQLTLSWPADHTGWILQSQTNTLGVGLGTNWVEVGGSSATNQATITINPAKGSVFYRLVSP
jgi:hypothetical protein